MKFFRCNFSRLVAVTLSASMGALPFSISAQSPSATSDRATFSDAAAVARR